MPTRPLSSNVHKHACMVKSCDNGKLDKPTRTLSSSDPPPPHAWCAAQMLRVEGMDALAEERDREVRAILQSINDLGQVMKDLSVLVIDQGTILDRIDANMDAVSWLSGNRPCGPRRAGYPAAQ